MKYFNLLFAVPALVILASCTTDPKVQSSRYVANGNKYQERGQGKQASIMYRRALQKNMKNADAWYKLGLFNLDQNNFGEGRGDLIRVVDLAEAENKYDAKVQDCLTKIADIDYTGYAKYPDKLKEYDADLKHRSDQLNRHYPNTFDSHRIAGLSKYSEALSLKKREERLPIVQEALADFKKADAIKPYDSALGFAIVSTLAETGQAAEAEKYANEMIARKTADERVYSSLYWYYNGGGHPDAAETIRKKQVANNPKDGSAWIALASHYYMAKRQPEMVAALGKLTSDLKTFPNANMLVGDFYFSLGDLEHAIGPYLQGQKVDASNKKLYMKKTAEAYTLLGRYDEAGKIVTELLKEDKNDPEAIAMDASLQLNHAKREEADAIIARLQPLLAKTSPNELEKSMILHFNLGRAYALKADPQSLDQARLQFEEALKARVGKVPYIPALMALSQLELARGGNPQAVEYANTIIRYAPANLTARLVRTMGLANMNEFDKARQELETLIRYKPDSTDTRFQLARLDMLQKKYKEAESEFEILVKANDSRGLTGLIECKVAEGNAAEGVGLIQAQLAKSPTNILYRNALATLYYNTGKYKEAAGEFQKLVDQNPNTEVGAREMWYLRLGESLRRGGDLDGAVGAFSKASELAPKHATPRLELAMLYEARGKSDEARRAYEEVLKLEPDNPVALNNIAYSKADTGTDLDGAMAFAQKARDKAPQNPDVLDTLGLIYFKKDLVDDSLRVFTDLVNRAPNSPTYHLHLAMALYKKGDHARAKRELDTASHNSPSGREQAQIKELISKIG